MCFKPVIDLESIPELSWFESFETSLWECCPDWVSIQIHERKSKNDNYPGKKVLALVTQADQVEQRSLRLSKAVFSAETRTQKQHKENLLKFQLREGVNVLL